MRAARVGDKWGFFGEPASGGGDLLGTCPPADDRAHQGHTAHAHSVRATNYLLRRRLGHRRRVRIPWLDLPHEVIEQHAGVEVLVSHVPHREA